MKEQLISIETANLAEEKGFHYSSYYDSFLSTQSLLQKWLRENKNIEVWAEPFYFDGKLDGSYSYFLFKDSKKITDDIDFKTYEQALEKGLFEALKLI